LKTLSNISVPVGTSAATTALVYGSEGPADAALILGHGAGAGQHSPFMVGFASALAELEIDVVTFNFLYTEERRRMPDSAPVLEDCYRAVIAATLERLDSARKALYIGGKSLGGRIATHVAAADATLPLAGLVLLGYPLHPPGQPAKRRDAHLPAVRRPMLFVQGTRDTFGTSAELALVLSRLAPPPLIHAVAGGDHSFKVTGADLAKQAEVFGDITHTIAGWIAG
jgi:predicted alpha/beta-hydrolase family hydrolase